MRALAALLNSRDSAVQTASKQSLFPKLLGYLYDSFWWPAELRVEGGDFEEGPFNARDNLPTNPHPCFLKLGCHLAHNCLALLQNLSKKPEITTY